MFKLRVFVTIQRDDVTDMTVGCEVFRIHYFHSCTCHCFSFKPDMTFYSDF